LTSFCPLITAKVLALKATVLLLLTLGQHLRLSSRNCKA
jgi:hypothetical protein